MSGLNYRGFDHAALAVALAVLASSSSTAAPRTHDGTEPITRPSGLTPIRWIVIEENAAKAKSAAAGVDCTKFVLTQAQAARHLRRVRRIDEHDFNHMITWLPCYAAGRVGFTSGSHASWSIREDGAAWLRFDSGDEMFLYCPHCPLPRTGSWLVD